MGYSEAVQKPTYDELLEGQIDAVTKAKGKGDLDKLFRNDDLWVVESTRRASSRKADVFLRSQTRRPYGSMLAGQSKIVSHKGHPHDLPLLQPP